MKPIVIHPTEVARAAERACGQPNRRPILVEARNDGRETKAGEVKRMWATFAKQFRSSF